jgi:hypothetical protein
MPTETHTCLEEVSQDVKGATMREYEIELEIFEGKGATITAPPLPDLAEEGLCAWMLGNENQPEKRVGQTLQYPRDLGKLCPWMVDSLTSFIRVLENGGMLPWRYKGTPCEKEIDTDGVTTEYVRCPDPTASGIVMKITRRAICAQDSPFGVSRRGCLVP